MSIYIARLSLMFLMHYVRQYLENSQVFRPVWRSQSPAVCGGRRAKSSKPSDRAQQMLGGQQWRLESQCRGTSVIIAVWLTRDAAYRQRRWPVCNSQQGTVEPCRVDICAWWHQVCMWLDLPHRANVGQCSVTEDGILTWQCYVTILGHSCWKVVVSWL